MLSTCHQVSPDEPFEACAPLAGSLSPPLQESNRGPSVETLRGSKRFEILVAQSERELEALLRQHVPNRGGVMRTDGRCDRLHFASVAAVADA